jgi:ketosteroid isomerase-like protein
MMRRPVWPACGLVLLIAAAPLTAQTAPPCPGPPDVCAFFATFMSALNRRDWDAFRATFADDITVIFAAPGPPERQDGRAAVEAVFQNIFPKSGDSPAPLPPPLKPDSVLVQDFGDVAVVSFVLRRPDQLGRRTLVFHRTEAGWKVVHIHGSSASLSTP